MKVTLKSQRALTLLGGISLVVAMQSLPAGAATLTSAHVDAPVIDLAGDGRPRPENLTEVMGTGHVFDDEGATDLPAVFELNHKGQRTLPATVIKDAPAGGSEMIVDPSETGIVVSRAGSNGLVVYAVAENTLAFCSS